MTYKSVLKFISRSQIIISIIFTISLVGLWPGILSPDALTQYANAKAGVFTDHHPPLMGFIWKYMDYIYPGSGSIFIIHLLLIYISVAIWSYIYRDSKLKWWYVIYPLLPNIVAYTALIVKDTSFTFSYLLAGTLLSFLSIKQIDKYKNLILLSVVVLLLYGTAVKFQAKFILLFFTLGVAYCYTNYKFNLKSLIYGLALFSVTVLSINSINNMLVTSKNEKHSWQYVKIYDLSAISLATNKALYPDYILQQPNFNFDLVKDKFLAKEVDPLVFYDNPVITAAIDIKQRNELWDYWCKTVIKHPFLYLTARIKLFKFNLTSSPCGRSNIIDFLARTTLKPLTNISWIATIIENLYEILKTSMAYIWFAPLTCLYTYLGCKYFYRTRFAPPLLLFSVSSLSLMITLLFFSMAATSRYVFVCVCFTHIAHPLAICVIKHLLLHREYRLVEIKRILHTPQYKL